ncbi:hypothetical protein ALC57_18496 [Trachymyrmex cornetzi]|uniref:Uncharacterized protein n=1 Tax=Trachymyrmex cornetzi TaxID=471704 RepID=A0A151IRU1_9HYME|nr:hypothetical protein ALC57_18496 [Trachymyrmex cornetzi]
MSIGLRSVIDSSLLLLVTFVFIVVLLELFESDKGGRGGGVGTFLLIFEGAGGGGGGGGRAGADVIVGGGGLDGKVLCTGGIFDKVFKGVLKGNLWIKLTGIVRAGIGGGYSCLSGSAGEALLLTPTVASAPFDKLPDEPDVTVKGDMLL